jgi:hypothetical protein
MLNPFNFPVAGLFRTVHILDRDTALGQIASDLIYAALTNAIQPEQKIMPSPLELALRGVHKGGGRKG